MPDKKKTKQLSYIEALGYLFSQLPMFQRIGPAAFKKDLTNTLAFCKHLGNPETKFPSIHIAGTNGKGSTAHMLAAIFTAAGYKTALYTSPHYRDFRERIKINGQLIPKKDVVDFLVQNREFAENLRPSFFEWTVALAFDYFAKEEVDVAIIETGLGGRLDSTNVVTPVLSVITNIGYDHMQMLGDTLPEIAFEKAGIIKKGVPVVVGESHPETKDVFLEKARYSGSPIYFADQHYEAKAVSADADHVVYEVSKDGVLMHKKLSINHLGTYQKTNLCTVLMSMDMVREKFPKISSSFQFASAIQDGLHELKKISNFIGRWEFISQSPRVLCDSAHNEDGIRMAMDALMKMRFRTLHFVFGTVNDKPPAKVLSLLPKEAKFYFAKAAIPRGLDAEALKQEAQAFGLRGKAYSSVRKALAAAKQSAHQDDLVFVGGSIFVVAEVI